MAGVSAACDAWFEVQAFNRRSEMVGVIATVDHRGPNQGFDVVGVVRVAPQTTTTDVSPVIPGSTPLKEASAWCRCFNSGGASGDRYIGGAGFRGDHPSPLTHRRLHGVDVHGARFCVEQIKTPSKFSGF